jgi:hypothetical protein
VAGRNHAARLAALEERLAEVAEVEEARQAAGDSIAEAGLTEAELERAGLWLLACRRDELVQRHMHAQLNQRKGNSYVDGEDEVAEDETAAELQQRYRYDDDVAAKLKQYNRELSDEAQWLHYRLQHGPGFCEVGCRGEFRHRPDIEERRDVVERAPAPPREEPLPYMGVGPSIWGRG